jgi:hypothetical protein
MDMKFVLGPDQFYFSFLRRFHMEIFKKVVDCGKVTDPGIVIVRRIFRPF